MKTTDKTNTYPYSCRLHKHKRLNITAKQQNHKIARSLTSLILIQPHLFNIMYFVSTSTWAKSFLPTSLMRIHFFPGDSRWTNPVTRPCPNAFPSTALWLDCSLTYKSSELNIFQNLYFTPMYFKQQRFCSLLRRYTPYQLRYCINHRGLCLSWEEQLHFIIFQQETNYFYPNLYKMNIDFF